MKIVFLDAKTVGDLKEIGDLENFGELEVYQTTKPEQVVKRTREADIVITNKVEIGEKIMKQCSGLKLICVAATGTNNVDLEAARARGIAVKNVRGYSTDSVAQHTFSMLFYLLNNLAFYSAYVSSGKYSRSSIFTCLDREITELKGKTFGIIGLGAIGQRVAEISVAFGASVIYYSTTGAHDHPSYKRCSLDELLQESDIISVHAPLTEQTKGLLDLEQLKKVKPGCILINTGRGGIVKEKDLVAALNKKIIFAAAIDVYKKEPLPKGHPFYKVKHRERLLLTPHVAWASIEARRTLIRGVEANIREYLEGTNS